MEIGLSHIVTVTESSGIGHARRSATAFAESLPLGEVETGRLSIIASEAATNLVKHAGGGEIAFARLNRGAARGVALLALDSGPGIVDVERSLLDGHSTSGTAGNGLGAIRRLSTSFDLYSDRSGTVLFSAVWDRTELLPAEDWAIGAIGVPFPGEIESGDGWAMRTEGSVLWMLLIDGLGHGAVAAMAAREAIAVFRQKQSLSTTADLMEAIHLGLRGTRGAAGAVIAIDPARRIATYTGVGNLSAAIDSGQGPHHLVSHHGTLGHASPRIQPFTYPWPRGSQLVFHSDGITNRWSLGAYPGLEIHHPMLTAVMLYRDFRRQRDDATVIVVRGAE